MEINRFVSANLLFHFPHYGGRNEKAGKGETVVVDPFLFGKEFKLEYPP